MEVLCGAKQRSHSKIAKECVTGGFAGQAPVLLVLVGNMDMQPDWFIHDLSFVSLQLALAAWIYGIGIC